MSACACRSLSVTSDREEVWWSPCYQHWLAYLLTRAIYEYLASRWGVR